MTDLTDGAHKATMDASYLTRLRTGAMTAIATDKLARQNAKSLGVIGTGNMAFEQVLGVVEVRDIQKFISITARLKKQNSLNSALQPLALG